MDFGAAPEAGRPAMIRRIKQERDLARQARDCVLRRAR
jgi:hypothetical protein